eukprot:s1851_g6.t1
MLPLLPSEALHRIRKALDAAGDGSMSWTFLGKRVCVAAWKKLHALGSGRFGRLIAAARKGEAVAPLDLRYLQKGVPKRGNAGGDETRGRVVTFLRGIYESVAETLPDVRDEGFDDVDAAADKVAQLPQAELDPYAQAIGDPQLRFKLKPKTKGVRAQRMGLQVNIHRRPENGYEKRWLPPGYIREYYEQFLATESTMTGSELFRSKDLGSFVRPKAHIAAALMHGRGIVFSVSPADVRKDANASIELIAVCLTHLSKEMDLRKLRTKNNMADLDYTFNLVYFPYEVARVRLPLGLPAGVAPKNPVSADLKKDVLNKYLPVMRQYGMDSAADYLEQWVQGTLPLEPLADVSALGKHDGKEARNQVTHYVAAARRRIAIEAAAEAWANGVPWGTAIKVCTKAVKVANPKAKPVPRGSAAPKRRARRG